MKDEVCTYCDAHHICIHCGKKIGLSRRFVKWVSDHIYDADDMERLLLATGGTFLLICAGIWVLKHAGVF